MGESYYMTIWGWASERQSRVDEGRHRSHAGGVESRSFMEEVSLPYIYMPQTPPQHSVSILPPSMYYVL